MKKLLVLLTLTLTPGLAFAAKTETKRRLASADFKVHQCESDAIERAGKLIRLHFMDDSNATNIENLSIDDHVTKKAPIKPAHGKGKFDVLEVGVFIYKAEYRTRFIYAQIKEECVLMGQEIFELSNPY